MKNKNLIILLVIVLVAIAIISLLLLNKENSKTVIVRQKLNEIYGSSYDIIDSYYMWDTGGSKDIESIIKINDTYSLFMYDIAHDSYTDAYKGLKKGNDYLENNQIMNIKNVSVLYLDETMYSGAWGNVELRIIVESKDYNSDNLAIELEKVINELGTKYERFNLNIYITDNIVETKTDVYKLFLTSQLGYKVDEEFYNKYNKNLVYKDFCVNFATNKYNEKHYWTIETIKKELSNHKI